MIVGVALLAALLIGQAVAFTGLIWMLDQADRDANERDAWAEDWGRRQ